MALIALCCLSYAQAPPTPYVTITGTLQGPNGLPLANDVISLTPTQSFFVAGSGGGGSNVCLGICLISPGVAGIVVADGIDGNTSVAAQADIITALGFTPANDAGVVHNTGTENVGGVKTFTSDTTFSGNLNLAGSLNFTAAGPFFLQAKKQTSTPVVTGSNDFGLYLDSGNTFRCILSGGASCNFLGGLLLNPGTSQNVIQPVGTQFSANNFANIRYVTATWSWLQTDVAGTIGNLAAAGSGKTLTLTPCPVGLDLTNTIAYGPFSVRIAGTGTAEAAPVTGGTCTSGAASGTIIVTTTNTHSAGFTVGSAYAGIQEALNNAGTPNWHVVLPPGSYSIYAPIVIHQNKGELEGPGADLNCFTLSRCLQAGSLTNSNDFGAITVRGLRFRPQANDGGCAVTSVLETGGTRTVNFTGSCTFIAGDFVRVDLTDDPAYWGDHIITAATASSVSWTQGAAGTGSHNTPGTIAHTNDAILDNAGETKWLDIKYQAVGSGTCTNPRSANTCTFNAFFDFWDDENATVDNFNSDGYGLECWTTYCGWFVYSVGNVGPTYCTGGTCAPVISISHSNITAGCSNGVVDHNNNGLHISDTVIQATAYANVISSNLEGNYQGTLLDNVYNESVGCANTPYAGNLSAGVGGDIYGLSSGVASFTEHGLFNGGAIPQTGSGSIPLVGVGTTQLNYWIVAHDTTSGGYTAPMLVQTALTNLIAPVIVNWPRIVAAPFAPAGQLPTDSITYDLIRTSGVLHGLFPASVGPYNGGCLGGSVAACGSVLTNQAQTSGLIQTFTDTPGIVTTSYAVPSPVNTLYPVMAFWPGDLIISTTIPRVFVDQVQPNTTYVAGWQTGPAVYSIFGAGDENMLVGVTDVNNFANGAPLSNAQVLTDVAGNAGATNAVKGRQNFYHRDQYAPGGGMSIMTLWDSNPDKTMATSGHRPLMDAADAYIGIDNPTTGFTNSQAQIAYGCPISCSFYVNSLPNNTSFLERLTASAKTFNVAATFNNGLTAKTISTSTNCAVNSVSPAACGSAASGAVVIPTTTTTYTVNTSAVTSHSRIGLTWLTFASDLPTAPTCVAPSTTTMPTISAVSAGVSFTITMTSTTGQTCPQFDIRD